MTQDEIIELARTVSNTPLNSTSTPDLFGVNQIVNFAKLVAEREREECAKVCDEYAGEDYDTVSDILAESIRARQ